MNSTQKRDIYYSFVKTARKPILTSIIDDEWRRQTLKELDIVLPANMNNKFNIEGSAETDHRRGAANLETKDWPDLGITELVSNSPYNIKISTIGRA